MLIDEILDLGLPVSSEFIGLVPSAIFFERTDQIGDYQFVIGSGFIGGPFHCFHGNSEECDGRAIGALEIAVLIQVMHHGGIIFGDEIHLVVQQDDVGIIVNSPDVLFAALVVVLAFAVGFPVRNAVDRIRIGLLVGLLQAAPDVVANVIFQRIDFLRIR